MNSFLNADGISHCVAEESCEQHWVSSASPGNYKEIVWDLNYLGEEDYKWEWNPCVLGQQKLGPWVLVPSKAMWLEVLLVFQEGFPIFQGKTRTVKYWERKKKNQTEKKLLATHKSGRLDRKSRADEHRTQAWRQDLGSCYCSLFATVQETRQFLESRVVLWGQSQAHSFPALIFFMKLPGSFVVGPAWKTMGSEGSTISWVPKGLTSPFQRGWWEIFLQFFPGFSRICGLQTQ